MDDMANGTRNDDDAPDAGLRDRLAWIGDQIPVHPSGEDLIGVERAASRRVRTRRVMAGLIGAGALVVGATVVTNLDGDDGGGDSIALTADEAERPEQDEDDAGGDGEAQDYAAPADEEPADAAGDVSEVDEAGDGGAVATIEGSAGGATMASAERTTVEAASGPQAFMNVQIAPWRDGFLAVEARYAPQPLPAEFNEQVTNLLSAEVVELIQAEQPTTIDEATALLDEAGLLDEVTEVLADNPEASEAILGVERPEPEMTARFSTDGIDWEPIELALPWDGWFGGDGLSSDGDRIVVSQMVFAELEEPIDPASSYRPAALESVRIGSTDDLRDWEVVEVPIDASAEPVPDMFIESVFPSSVAVGGDRWVIQLEQHMEPDIEAIFADVRGDRPGLLDTGYGVSTGDEGIVLEITDRDGDQLEFYERTWAELGIEPIGHDMWARGSSVILAGSFDGGTPARAELDGYGSIVGFDGGFLRLGEPTFLSTDGVEWVEVEMLGGAAAPSGPVIDRGGDLVAFGAGMESGDPREAFVLDVDAALWRPTSGPTLLADSYASGSGGVQRVGAAVVYQANPHVEPEPFEVSASVEIDGYTFTQTRTHVGDGYALARDGVEIVAEFLTWDEMVWDSEEGPFEHRRFSGIGGQASTVLDPESGEELVTISEQQARSLWSELDRSTPNFNTFVEPEVRLLASDGERWLDEQLVDSSVVVEGEESERMERWPVGAAANGGIVVVVYLDGGIDRFEF